MERIIKEYVPGHVWTNGKDYGTIISLAVGLTGDDYYLIAEEEYAKIQEAERLKAEEELGMPPGYTAPENPDDATEADYQSALGEFGVQL